MTRMEAPMGSRAQSRTCCKTVIPKVVSSLLIAFCCIQSAFAKSGGVDYSWGAEALARAHDYIVTMMLYVLYVCYAVGGIIVVISSLQIYLKMQEGGNDVKKDIMLLIGAILYLIGASVVFPAFFGYRI